MLAQAWSSSQQGYAPSGASIFYYTRLNLLRLGYEPAIELTAQRLSRPLIAVFLKTAPDVGKYLAAEYDTVLRVLSNPLIEGTWLIATQPAPLFPGLVEQLMSLGSQEELPPFDVLARWSRCWKCLATKSRPALALFLNFSRLLVAPIARPVDSERMALHMLRARLAEDALSCSCRLFSADTYLYTEPFSHWFARTLITQPWFQEFWRELPLED